MRREDARRTLSAIYGWFTEGLDTPDLKKAGALLEELSAGGDGARWEQAVAIHTAT
jgi:hypothetical protein